MYKSDIRRASLDHLPLSDRSVGAKKLFRSPWLRVFGDLADHLLVYLDTKSGALGGRNVAIFDGENRLVFEICVKVNIASLGVVMPAPASKSSVGKLKEVYTYMPSDISSIVKLGVERPT